MRKKQWVILAAGLAMAGSVSAALLVYESFEYDVTSGGINGASLDGGTGLANSWSSSDTAGDPDGNKDDANFEITAGSYSAGALPVSSNKLKRVSNGGIEAIERTISATLPATGEFWFSVLHEASSTTQFGIGGGGFEDGSNGSGNMSTGPGFGFSHTGDGLFAAAWPAGSAVSRVGGNLVSQGNGEVLLLVGHVQRNAGGNDIVDLYEVDATLAQPASPISSVTNALAAGTLNTLTMSSNRKPGVDEIRIGDTYTDVVPVSAVFSFNLTPSDQQDIQVDYPATLATNSIVTEYVNSTLGVEIMALNVTGDSNAFSAVTSTPFINSTPSPATVPLEIAFDASAFKAITGSTGGFNANGSVDVVWRNLDDGVIVTNTVSLVGDFNNPLFEFNIDSSLSLTLAAPATIVSNDITVSYVEGRPGHTNVEIVAVNILDASHTGFSAINPGVIANPEPASDVISVTFDNSGGELGNKEGATANLEVIWGEVGSGTASTSTVPVSAYNYDLQAGVLQQVFGSPVALTTDAGSGKLPMNNFEIYTNQWNSNGNFEQDTSAGCIKLTSSANTRSAFNLIEANTAGSDNFGAVDTHILTNGFYRYDFDYEVLNSEGASELWSFNAYALVNQGAFSTNSNPDKVLLDIATGTSGGVPVDIEGDGNAFYSQHPNGTRGGTNDVGRSSGSVYLNVQDDQDALFVMHRSGKCTVRLYDLVLTRIGDYDTNTATNNPNAVIAAKFDELSSTNSIITGLDDTTCNSNGVNNTWRGSNVVWDNQAFKSIVNANSFKASAIITRAGTAGYDDVGVPDTIALTEGAYDLTLDIQITGGFPSNDSVVRVEFYALTQDVTPGVNDVIIKHNVATVTDEYIVINGLAAEANLLGSQTFTSDTVGFETVSLSSMSVLDGQDVALIFYHAENPDVTIDNVELVRTGDLPSEGYDGWALGQGLTPGVNDDLLYDAEDGGLGDGLNNLMEYALDGDPLFDDAATVAPQISEDSGYFYHTYKERTDDSSLTFTVELNDNLILPGGWGTAGLEAETRGADDGTWQRVTNSTDTAEVAEFIRLEVQKD